MATKPKRLFLNMARRKIFWLDKPLVTPKNKIHSIAFLKFWNNIMTLTIQKGLTLL